ncbi:MAG: hypothetical protein EOR01_23060 [Mesorhizobium sp.]|uniref:hypothetical protein n=1 Tax=Mesorhizobium sp. TaxID=1871066 RepID=UPI000FE6FEA5|nr:hypothetical protein [Mesorhizobium sp.]RWP18504.1 MAG: hypothetical protein EOR01_23060 [Mesorhizobium sp.]
MPITRRSLLKAAAASPFTVIAVPIPIPVFAEPATGTLIIAGLAVFSKILAMQSGKKNPTGALLMAIDGKLDIVIAQLASIQTALGHLVVQIEELKQDVLDAIDQQFADEMFNNAKAGLRLIANVQRDARSKRVSLDLNNPNRKGLELKLKSAYEEFDLQRRRLQEYPLGHGIVSAPLVDACVLADHIAFAAGIIDATQLSITLEHHLNWLDQMASPASEHSVATFQNKAAQKENELRNNIGNAAQKNNPESAVASGLLTSRAIAICAIHTMDVRYWSEAPNKNWLTLRNNEYMIVPSYSGKLVDIHGAKLFRDTKYIGKYPLQLKLGNGYLSYSYNGAPKVDKKKCKRFSNALVVVDAKTITQLGIADEFANTPKFNKNITSAISGAFIEKSTFARQISTDGPDTAVKAQKLLDQVNEQILKQRLAELALMTIAENRKFSANIAAALPRIPQLEERP